MNFSIPLVYTQVVTIAVYTYFLNAMFSAQLEPKTDYVSIDFGYFPVFLTLQFMFYMGWLKVAEQCKYSHQFFSLGIWYQEFFLVLNPFGEDEDDFDVNSMIDKNLQTAYLIVDDMHNDHPMILRDVYWDEIPIALPDNAPDAKEV